MRDEREREGAPSAVRFQVPEGETAWEDLIRGDSVWVNEQIGDFIILRADGSPTYQLAVVVDDHDMGVTLVMRGADHLSNAPKQILLFKALGYDVPDYAHTTLILGPDGKKLSKRHGATSVLEYRERGYLPAAMVNFLTLLGWSLDDKTETFTRDEMIAHFTLDRVNRSAASFDPQKLQAFQERQMNAMSIRDKVGLGLPFLQRARVIQASPSEADFETMARVVQAAGDRIKVAGDILSYPEFFQPDASFSYDDQAFDKRVRPARGADLLRRFQARLQKVEPFDAMTLERVFHEFVESLSI